MSGISKFMETHEQIVNVPLPSLPDYHHSSVKEENSLKISFW